jgi:hypothetical protein
VHKEQLQGIAYASNAYCNYTIRDKVVVEKLKELLATVSYDENYGYQKTVRILVLSEVPTKIAKDVSIDLLYELEQSGYDEHNKSPYGGLWRIFLDGELKQLSRVENGFRLNVMFTWKYKNLALDERTYVSNQAAKCRKLDVIKLDLKILAQCSLPCIMFADYSYSYLIQSFTHVLCASNDFVQLLLSANFVH